MSALTRIAHDLAREGFPPNHLPAPPAAPLDPVWTAVRATGTRLWLDTGDLEVAARLWTGDFEALTTNNTLLNKEVQKGLYDDLVRRAASALRAAEPALSERDLLLEIAFILNARHGLRLVERFGAFVSVELHTDLADDVGRAVAYGLRFHRVCPERFFVKIPLTAAGFAAARRLALASVPVNFTLGFSARQNVAAALLAQPNYVNVFMGRLNAFVADHRLGDGRNVGEKATLATQRALRRLRREGRSGARLIGASMRDAGQVAALAGVDVYTMPTKVAEEYRARPAASLASRVAEDPDVELRPGVRLADFNGATLWDVPPEFLRAADALARHPPDALDGPAVERHFRSAGFSDFLPAWTDDDRAALAGDGKIPNLGRWAERLQRGAIGLDALMNAAGLLSFAADQRALDDRVRSLV